MRNKALRLLFLSALLFLAASFAVPAIGEAKAAQGATESRAECVVEVSSKRFLYERNADLNLPMASTTKILTAMIVIDDCDLDERIAIPKEAVGVEGSSVYLKEGEEYTVLELLYGLMLRSGNDCAETLALHHSGSIEAFADVMNRRAVALGAERSRFVNPHGLPAKGHYTTARDLSLIAAYAMQNEQFRSIVSCKYYQPRHWQNKNKMLFEYDGAIGVKTGFTLAAGRCLVTSAERNGMTVVSVVLNSPQMYERTAELLDDCYERFSLQKLCDKSLTYERYAVREDFYYPLMQAEVGLIEYEYELLQNSSVKSGELIGQMRIFLENKLLFSQNLYMI